MGRHAWARNLGAASMTAIETWKARRRAVCEKLKAPDDSDAHFEAAVAGLRANGFKGKSQEVCAAEMLRQFPQTPPSGASKETPEQRTDRARILKQFQGAK